MKRIVSVFAVLALMITLAVPASAVSKPAAPKLKSVSNTSRGITIKWSAVKNAEKYLVFRKAPTVKYKKINGIKTNIFL